MTIKQVEADIAAGTYVSVLDCVNNFEKELNKLVRESCVDDEWDEGWEAALHCVRVKFKKCMEAKT